MRSKNWTRGKVTCGQLHIAVLIIILVTQLIMTEPTQAQSRGTVRGQLLWQQGSPAAYILIRLFAPDGLHFISGAESDANGMYFFYNIGAGAYVLEIWPRGTSQRPTKYGIRVLPQSLTDIPPIRLS
jgi:hypothetical protein